MKGYFLLYLCIILLPLSSLGQNKGYWQSADVKRLSDNHINYTTQVEDALYFNLDKNALSLYLEQAPDRYLKASSSISIQLPNPAGEFDTFKIYSTQTMARDLANEFSEVKSYIGYNKDKKSHTARITITPTGLYVMTTGSDFGQTFINPYAINSDVHFVFNKESSLNNQTHVCGVDDEHIVAFGSNETVPYFIDEGNLRKYRLAVATTVEYSDFHWQAAGIQASDSDTAKKAAVQAAIVVSVDRINQMFERDFGVTLELVSNNSDVIFLGNPNNDPYDNTNHFQMIEENQNVLDTQIGSANYDVGHVFNTNGGGLAYTPSVCNNSFKAGGSTGLSSPVGDPFNIDIAAHEFGHQFGANHTQNNNTNRNDATAVETGSGSTIMGYAGVSAPNVQINSDAMFHYISISEVSSRFSGFNGNCAEIISIANESPIVEPISNYTIPQNTAFMLQAEATDADGDDLTYSWEQLDNEIAVMPPLSTSTNGPAFRTFLPTSSPIRHFPSMSTLISGNYANTWEALSTVNRTYNFGVVVRDNNPLGGQVATQTTTITVNDSAGPFRVTSQDEFEDPWLVNDTKTITWNVANTDNPTGINAQNVDILLSLDGGETFSEVLLENTPNDGQEDIVVPDVTTANARIMVKASDNIFFDINEQAFAIGTAFVPEYCEAGSQSQDFTNISNVQFNTINNTSGNDGYSDFTSIYTRIRRGESYNLSVRSSGNSLYTGDQVIVWIDFNQNGRFDDPGEKVIETASFSGNFNIYPFGGPISIPPNASLGETTMRIRINNSNFGTSNQTPCGNSSFGEVEDYKVVLFDDYLYYDAEWFPENPSGISTAQDNILVINGETSLSLTTLVKDMTLLISSKLNISGILKVDGDIKNNGDLVFISNNSITGQLDSFSGSISRPVEVQRYIPARRAFRFLSSAVNSTENIRSNWQENPSAWNDDPNPNFGTHITGVEPNSSINADIADDGLNGFDWQPSGAPSLFTFNNLTQSWPPIANTDVNTLQAGSAYRLMVRGNRSIDLQLNGSLPTPTTLRARGELHTGAFNINSDALSSSIYGFNFFGNPYQAAVDLTAVIANSTNLHPFIYVYDPTLGGTESRGAFVTVDVSGDVGNGTNNNADSNANQYLQPGQAVLVQTLSDAPASIQFLESHKAVNQPQTAIFNTESNLSLQLYDAISFGQGDASRDGVRIRFSDTYSNEVDGFDATKMANQDENIATINGSALFSIESRSMPDVGEEIPLFINAYRTTDYVLKANINQISGVKTLLVDHYLNTNIELTNNQTTSYAFSVDASQPASVNMLRFSLLFENETLGINDFDEVGFSIYPNPTQQGKFSIQTKGLYGEKAVVNIYNMLGQRVFSERFNTIDENEIQINAGHLSTGMYNVKLIQDQKTFVEKLIVK